MPDSHCTISHGLLQALQRYHAKTGESLGQIVCTALTEYLQVSHSTLFQVSTSAALVQGIYQGQCVWERSGSTGTTAWEPSKTLMEKWWSSMAAVSRCAAMDRS